MLHGVQKKPTTNQKNAIDSEQKQQQKKKTREKKINLNRVINYNKWCTCQFQSIVGNIIVKMFRFVVFNNAIRNQFANVQFENSTNFDVQCKLQMPCTTYKLRYAQWCMGARTHAITLNLHTNGAYVMHTTPPRTLRP